MASQGLAPYFPLLGSSHPVFELTVNVRRDSYDRLACHRNSQARTMLQFAIPSPAVPFAHGSAVTITANARRWKCRDPLRSRFVSGTSRDLREGVFRYGQDRPELVQYLGEGHWAMAAKYLWITLSWFESMRGCYIVHAERLTKEVNYRIHHEIH